MMGKKTQEMERKTVRTREEKFPFMTTKYFYSESRAHLFTTRMILGVTEGLPSLKCTINLATCDSGNGIKVEMKELKEKRWGQRLARGQYVCVGGNILRPPIGRGLGGSMERTGHIVCTDPHQGDTGIPRSSWRSQDPCGEMSAVSQPWEQKCEASVCACPHVCQYNILGQ